VQNLFCDECTLGYFVFRVQPQQMEQPILILNNQLQTHTQAYFKSLTIENIKCFKTEQTLELSDSNGLPVQWTVILGNNNTGKTTLLRCLADLEVAKKYQLYHKVNVGIDSPAINQDNDSKIGELIIYGYGTSRRMGMSSLTESNHQEDTASLFSDEVTLINAEEWLLQTDYAAKNGALLAKSRLAKIKHVLTGGILPDVSDFRFTTTEKLNSFVEVQTDYGWIRFSELGYGYQTTIAWVVDLAKRLFDRYPNSQNPLTESAIVLVDEIDLHLHPEWQRKIIEFLTHQFPNTQFIVTSHSPLVVQSANKINLVLLKKKCNQVTISRPQFTTYQGWRVDEILDELMGLGEKTQSESYLALIKQFDEALDQEDYAKAKMAYEKLDNILHPESHQRKLLRLQMSSLMPEKV
jgi:predicted ATP-binding protein involved in virulence